MQVNAKTAQFVLELIGVIALAASRVVSKYFNAATQDDQHQGTCSE